MTARKSKASAKATPPDKNRSLAIQAEKGEEPQQTAARIMLAPYLRHGVVAEALAEKMVGNDKLPGGPRFDDYAEMLKARSDRAGEGDLTLASETLAAQAMSLDAIFTEYARRSVSNAGQYVDAAERYMRLALKAQANSRATIEALVKLHQPREQIVRHVHVNEGAQAVIADQFHHHHAGGNENARNEEQCHAPENRAAGEGPALPGPDPFGNGVPIASGKGAEAVPDARRQESGRT